MLTLIYNANVILVDKIVPGYVVVEDKKIKSVGFDEIPELPYDRKIDAEGKYLSPGFVELHTHGAGGADYSDATLEAFQIASQTHMEHGTTTILPTPVPTTREDILKYIDAFRLAKKELEGKGPYLHGLHMEGPFLSKDQISRMVFMCGASLPSPIIKLLAKYEGDPKALRQAGIEYASAQLVEIAEHGVGGLHVYCMNHADIARAAMTAVRNAGF